MKPWFLVTFYQEKVTSENMSEARASVKSRVSSWRWHKANNTPSASSRTPRVNAVKQSTGAWHRGANSLLKSLVFFLPTFFLEKKVGKKSRRGDRPSRSQFFL